jgi:hypothetical protein
MSLRAAEIGQPERTEDASSCRIQDKSKGLSENKFSGEEFS